MAKDLTKSSSNLNDIVYSGRPRNEDPHVKRTTKRKTEKIEYIVRVDLDELKIDDDTFDDLQSLYELFDRDRDGILNTKEFEKLLRCLGYRLGEEQTKELASTVSVDKTHFSVSFNEFLRLMSNQQDLEPDEETLVQVFESFDKDNTGMISETVFKQIMRGKDDINEEDINDMLKEYYSLAKLKGLSTTKPEGVKDEDTPPRPPPPRKGRRRSSKAVPSVTPATRSSYAQQQQKSAAYIPKTGLAVDSNSGLEDKSSNKSEETDERWIDYKEFAAMLQQ